MHKATVFWLALAVLCGTLLFHTSQQVTDGRTALRAMEREVLREEESLRVLQAEWSYLNQPERLEKLAREYLDLQPLNGRQFARVTDLNERIDDSAAVPAEDATATSAVEKNSQDTATPRPSAAAVAPARTAQHPPQAIEPAAGTPHAAPLARKYDGATSAAPPRAPASPPPAAPARTPSRGFDDVLKTLGAN